MSKRRAKARIAFVKIIQRKIKELIIDFYIITIFRNKYYSFIKIIKI